MGQGRAGQGVPGGALAAVGASFLLWALLLLVLVAVDSGLTQDLARLQQHQQRLRLHPPPLWQRLGQLRERLEQEEKDGWHRAASLQRLGAELLRLRREGSQFGTDMALQETKLRDEISRLLAARGTPAPPHA